MGWRSTRTLGLKVASLCLGTLLWLTVTGHQIERRISVPVSYSNVPAPLVLTGEQVDAVSVHVRGDDTVLSGLRDGELRVVVNLKDARPGSNVVPLRNEEIIAPPRVEVLQVDPGAINVTLERSGAVQVPVRPSIDGRPARGFIIKNVSVWPEQVTVHGPESRLHDTLTVVTERVSVDGQTTTLVREVGVAVMDSQLRIPQPKTVRVTVTVQPATPANR